MQNDITQKQAYLYKQIIEGGYNAEQFTSFMIKSSPSKGDQLQKYRLHQIKKIVQDFQKICRENQKQTEEAIQVKNTETALNQENFITTIRCEKKQINKIYHMDFQIKVIKYEKIEGGIFERSYVVYTIETPALKSVVNRRFNDFVWFRQVLSVLAPGIPIPPITKKYKIIRYDDKHLTKKMIILEKFLNFLITISEIKADILFENFLTMQDPKQFQKFKSHMSKLHANIPVSRMKFISGEVTIGIDKQINQNIQRYYEYYKVTQPDIKKIYKNFKAAATELQKTSECLKLVSQNCKDIIKKDDNIRRDIGFPEIGNNNPFICLEIITREYANQLLLQAKTFRKEIYSIAKYESLCRLNMIQHIEELSKKHDEYIQQKNFLLRKKEKLYFDGNMSKWNILGKIQQKPKTKEQCFVIMLPRQTAEILIQKQIYGLYNYQTYEECLRHTKISNRLLCKHLHEFISGQTAITGSIMMVWGDILAMIEEIELNLAKEKEKLQIQKVVEVET